MESSIEVLLRKHEAAIAEACATYCVECLELFGSAVSGSFDPATSDLDFLVRFRTDARARAFDNYFGLHERLEALFGRPIELVTINSVRNARFLKDIANSRHLIYASHSPQAVG
jgi:hypothetical protein